MLKSVNSNTLITAAYVETKAVSKTIREKYPHYVYRNSNIWLIALDSESGKEVLQIKRGFAFGISPKANRDKTFKTIIYVGGYKKALENNTIKFIRVTEEEAKRIIKKCIKVSVSELRDGPKMNFPKPLELTNEDVIGTPAISLNNDITFNQMAKAAFGKGFVMNPPTIQGTPGRYVEGYWRDKKNAAGFLPWPEQGKSKNSKFRAALKSVESKATKRQFKGLSLSRWTGESLSSGEFTFLKDGTQYVWPDGYNDHYLKGGVSPTTTFVKFVMEVFSGK